MKLVCLNVWIIDEPIVCTSFTTPTPEGMEK